MAEEKRRRFTKELLALIEPGTGRPLGASDDFIDLWFAVFRVEESGLDVVEVLERAAEVKQGGLPKRKAGQPPSGPLPDTWEQDRALRLHPVLRRLTDMAKEAKRTARYSFGSAGDRLPLVIEAGCETDSSPDVLRKALEECRKSGAWRQILPELTTQAEAIIAKYPAAVSRPIPVDVAAVEVANELRLDPMFELPKPILDSLEKLDLRPGITVGSKDRIRKRYERSVLDRSKRRPIEPVQVGANRAAQAVPSTLEGGPNAERQPQVHLGRCKKASEAGVDGVLGLAPYPQDPSGLRNHGPLVASAPRQTNAGRRNSMDQAISEQSWLLGVGRVGIHPKPNVPKHRRRATRPPGRVKEPPP